MKGLNPASFETWNAIVRNSRRLHTAVLLCAMISVLSSCQRAQENRNTQFSLRERVEALNNESLGAMDSGRAYAHATNNTEFVISHKDEAVPILVEALKDEKKLDAINVQQSLWDSDPPLSSVARYAPGTP